MEIPTGILRRRLEAQFGRVASWGTLCNKWPETEYSSGHIVPMRVAPRDFDFINISSRKLLLVVSGPFCILK
jgi:hypothetical protein